MAIIFDIVHLVYEYYPLNDQIAAHAVQTVTGLSG